VAELCRRWDLVCYFVVELDLQYYGEKSMVNWCPIFTYPFSIFMNKSIKKNQLLLWQTLIGSEGVNGSFLFDEF
jgi:hypothetical protein